MNSLIKCLNPTDLNSTRSWYKKGLAADFKYIAVVDTCLVFIYRHYYMTIKLNNCRLPYLDCDGMRGRRLTRTWRAWASLPWPLSLTQYLHFLPLYQAS